MNDIAILIPCYNEELTIRSVIQSFKLNLPDAKIYVYDNNSTDNTYSIAEDMGAIVRREKRQGKGHVVRRMFSDIEADIYVLVDGDDTYDASAAPSLVAELLSGPFDKVNGARIHEAREAYRPGHVLGNKVLSGCVSMIFGKQSRDMLSGYKALSRRFVKSFPTTSSGFEIETELLIHGLNLSLPMSEIDTRYKERPEGSASKLSTVKDGIRILILIIHLVRDLRPLTFFGSIGLFVCFLSLIVAIPVILAFFETGLVARLPTALLAVGLMISGLFSCFTGLILDSVARGRREVKMLAYLSYPPVRR